MGWQADWLAGMDGWMAMASSSAGQPPRPRFEHPIPSRPIAWPSKKISCEKTRRHTLQHRENRVLLGMSTEEFSFVLNWTRLHATIDMLSKSRRHETGPSCSSSRPPPDTYTHTHTPNEVEGRKGGGKKQYRSNNSAVIGVAKAREVGWHEMQALLFAQLCPWLREERYLGGGSLVFPSVCLCE